MDGVSWITLLVDGRRQLDHQRVVARLQHTINEQLCYAEGRTGPAAGPGI